MPVTAKLSRKFYDRLGEDIANELVDWFNAVDETYRNDLRELNELNFSRFDAKMGQRLAEYDAKLDRRFADYDVKLEQRFAEFDAKLAKGVAEFDAKLVQGMAEFDAKLEQRLGEFEVKIHQGIAALEVKMHAQRVNLIKWMVVCWAGTVIPIVGTVIALAQ
jgi:hypothetical protein